MAEAVQILLIGTPPESLEKIWGKLRGRTGRLDRVVTAAQAETCLALRRYDAIALFELEIAPAGAAVVERLLRSSDGAPVVALSQNPSVLHAVRLTRAGAADYLPLEGPTALPPDAVEERLRRLAERRRCAQGCVAENDPFSQLVGRSAAMRDAVEVLRLVAPRQCTILLTGRTGTGKELAARAMHVASPRSRRPMVRVNCGAIPAALMEAELFGHVKGAFTGAVGARIGRFEQAHRGTIFLDEVGELPPELQSKLLRVLQEREFQRVGSSETIEVDVRVIAATNRDLTKMVEGGGFREDLYYRLNVVPVKMPNLAERLEDIPLLVEHLLERVCRREALLQKRAGEEALQRLRSYSWPGNVRELENAVEKAVALSGERVLLYPSDFPLPWAAPPAANGHAPALRIPAEGLDFDATVSGFERSLLEQALERSNGNKKRAAELLRIKRTTFAARWRSLGMAGAP